MRLGSWVAALAMLGSGCASFTGLARLGDTREAPAASSRFALSAATTQPAASGEVSLSQDANGNARLRIRVEHLAEPGRLQPPRAVYVAWVRAGAGAPAQNVGALKVDKDLRGALETVSAARSFQLLITAEPAAQVQQPTGAPQLWATISR